MPLYRYPWPASAITPQDMAILHAVRESATQRTSITQLIANAVHQTYGQVNVLHLPTTQPQDEKEIAA